MANVWLRHRPETWFGVVCTGVAGASWAYAILVALAFTHVYRPSPLVDRLAEWGAAPVQIPALLLIAVLLGRRGAGLHRQAWWCVLAFTAGSPLAAYVWNTLRPEVAREYLGVPDCIYLADYWALTAGFAVIFVHAGGSFRIARVWLDATTMTAVQLVAIWSFFVAPSVADAAGGGISVAATFAYSLTLACMMAMAALLYLRLPSLRGRAWVLLLIAAGVAEVAWEIMWMASWLTDRDLVGVFYNFGDVLCFAAVSSAVAATQFRGSLPSDATNPQKRADSFLPVLSVLVAIALVAGSVATALRSDGWILLGLVALCVVLLITRQQSVRRELHALNQQLAKREADARLTELVRRSADLIMVINAGGIVSFASPATETMLAMSVEEVQNTRAIDLFGLDHSPAMAAFLQRVSTLPLTQSVMELRVRRSGGADSCVIKVSAVNQLANQLINGIVLTLTDVTEQRLLEREVLDVSARERVRLCADIHDGLGQELVGISMLLHVAATAPDPDPAAQKTQLEAIVDHVNRSVVIARDLARGLSPLHVMRGSLSGALHRLAPAASTSVPLRLDVDAAFNEAVIDDFQADHLYRIAQEAVSNALRHSGCKNIDITLHRRDADVLLVIADDGRGLPQAALDYAGLGLRLMEYRARILGGTLRIDKAPGSGTRVEVTMPLDRMASQKV